MTKVRTTNRIGIVTLLLAVTLASSTGCGEHDITIGPDASTSGNYFGRDVSKQFGREQLQRLFYVVNSDQFHVRIQRQFCSPLPKHTFSVTLWTEGETRERQVRLQMTPRIYTENDCLSEGINYAFQQAVKSIDPGPPIDYHYHRSTGEPVDSRKNAEWLPNEPTCTCDAPK